ncbi:MAG: isoaspartyl peptidase/L-asparaginase [Ignavibacteriaceae bacterium]|nr:isoaspartyl peptidase/L-asparaginase [Ignavibacteriaceae bacterium]
MKYPILFIVSLLIIAATFFLTPEQKSGGEKFLIVIHGGAGSARPGMTEEEKQAHIAGLNTALTTGYDLLGQGKDALSVVEAVIRVLEDDSLFNAGRGAVLTSEGFASHDASIMNGIDLTAGAVGDVRRIKNPISLARMVMEKSNHVLMVGDGAEKFAEKQGVGFVPPEYFITEDQKATLKKRLDQMNKAGTVGCVVLDKNGNLAAGTSTGGMTGKLPGRLGDTPIIGAGTYANNATCAVSATGWGEKFIKNAVAFRISALMEYKGYTLKQAVKEVLDKNLAPKDGGVIAVDRAGNYEMYYTTPSMYRGVMTSDGIKEIKIWE